MRNIEDLDTSGLINRLVRYIAIAVFSLSVLIVISISLAREQKQAEVLGEHNKQIDNSINHVVEHFINDYSYRVRRLVETTNLAELVEDRDREGVFALLNPKYQLMREESDQFRVMQVHLADGNSFLRLHSPDHYGDNIAQKRVMLREIHKNHKIISGYESGVHATVFRIITPIFNKKGSYLGALEIGVNPNFIVEAIYEINGICGAVFIKEKELQLHSTPNTLLIDGYRLQNDMNEELESICAKYSKESKLLNNYKINVGKEEYLTHLIILENFLGEESVKLLFFQNITRENPFFNKSQFYIYLGILISLLLLIWLVYYRIKEYQKKVTTLYKKQIAQLEKDETAIANSQKYHKALFDTIPDILIVTNGENIEDANRAMLEFFAYETIEEFSGEHKCICDFFEEEEGYLSAEMGGKTWLEYIKSNPLEIHKVNILKDGVSYDYLVSIEELKYDDNNRNIVSFVNITELEELNDRLEIAVTGTNDGLWDWNLVTGSFYFSPQWKKQLGYEDNELEDAFEVWESRVHPDDKEEAMSDYRANMNGETDFFENIHRLRHKDGSWVWVLDRGQTKFDRDGKAVRMVGFHTDITKQKELEEELKSSRKQFEQFMDNMPYVAIIKDENYNVIYENEVAKKYRDATAIGLSADETFPKEVAVKINKLADTAIEIGTADTVIDYEYKGEEHIFRSLAFAIPQEDGKVYVGAIYINITEEMLLSKALKLQEEMMIAQSRHAAMGEMISMIAHQWRQPISVIAMDANNVLVDIELESVKTDSLKHDVEDIIEQTIHLSKTIDDFRNFFKPNKIRDEVLISDVFEESLLVIGKSMENNNISFEKDFHTDTLVKIFSRELIQVFINLLKNAKEALEENREENRKIINTITESEEDVIITIKDNAGGISDENIKKVFDPYFSTKGEKNGTGLGLYMSKTIIEKHLLGTLNVHNINENGEKGVCFTVVIPKKVEGEGDE